MGLATESHSTGLSMDGEVRVHSVAVLHAIVLAAYTYSDQRSERFPSVSDPC